LEYIYWATFKLDEFIRTVLVVGILVDDAIVVLLENIFMEMGKNRVRAAYDGTAEIGGTVTSITVIVVVFLPIALSSV
jgi:HAE1 family hydrophobic/amphiphilic exporter-1